MNLTTGTTGPTLAAVRCAHRPCLDSGRGLILFELSTNHEHITVTALARREGGFTAVKKCEHCGGWNGVNYELRRVA